MRIFGVRIDRLNWSELDIYCQQALLEEIPKHIVTANGEILLRAEADKKYAETLNSADLVVPESTNVAWVAHWNGKPIKVITAGSDLVDHLAKIAAVGKKSIFLLGGKEGIAKKAGRRLVEQNPSLKIAGASSANPDDLSVVDLISRIKADIILVGYGAPKQEVWIAENKNKLGAKILVGIGGTFDMLAGITPRSPLWMRQTHLEWLWRLILQPSRLPRIWKALVIFPFKAIFS